MLLAIDIGNSSISLGLFDTPDGGAGLTSARPQLGSKAKIAADPRRSADEYRITLNQLLRDGGYTPADVDAAVIGSVVPSLTHSLREAVARLCRPADGSELPIRTVGAGTRSGLILSVDDPAQLGADIVTNAAAAVWLYGAPVVVLDFGTATVLSCVDGSKTLLGVSILPGLQTSLDGLHGAAALLPNVELRCPESVLGRSTADAICAGVVYGSVAMAEGLVERALREAHLPEETPVVVTGGLAPLVLPLCRRPMHREEALTLYGLYRVFELTIRRERR